MMSFRGWFARLSTGLGVSALLVTGAGVATTTSASAASGIGEQNTMAVAWYQTSAEAKALYIQGYNLGKKNIDKSLSEPSKLPRAVILDIDETVLDNSPIQAYNVINDTMYPVGWKEWVKAGIAKPVPGAKDFLNYADSKGIQIFYVSDRDTTMQKDTERNLKEQGLPQVDSKHVLLKGKNDKTKEERRQAIEKKYNVIMLFGDNLTDFNDPKTNTLVDRQKDVTTNSSLFGTKYIILPNPMYGSWEAALYNNDYSRSDQMKTWNRKSSLTYFDPKTGKLVNVSAAA